MIAFSATAKINDGPLLALRALLTAPPAADVGVFASAGADVVKRATINEFGGDKGNNPPRRSFIVSTLSLHNKVYAALISRGVRTAIQSGKPQAATEAVEATAERYKRDIGRRIDAGISPRNAPSTVARKGFNHPLIETGEMKRSLAWRVRE